MTRIGESSNLNPLANSFVPSRNSESSVHTNSSKPSSATAISQVSSNDLQEKYLKDRCEFIRVVQLFNSDRSQFAQELKRDMRNNLFAKDLLEKELKKNLQATYLISTVESPKPTSLLNCFWGLYRNEQAVRPLMTFTKRPKHLTDRVWSIGEEDKKLWNPSCISQPCGCPAMFGYNVPPDLFGNPFNLPNSCEHQGIHLSHYREVDEGNESSMLESRWTLHSLPLDDVALVTHDNLGTTEDNETLASCTQSLKYAKLNLNMQSLKELEGDFESFESNQNVSCNERFENPGKSEANGVFSNLWNEVTRNIAIYESSESSEEKIEGHQFSYDQEFQDNVNGYTDATLPCIPPCSIWCDSSLRNEPYFMSNSNLCSVDLVDQEDDLRLYSASTAASQANNCSEDIHNSQDEAVGVDGFNSEMTCNHNEDPHVPNDRTGLSQFVTSTEPRYSLQQSSNESAAAANTPVQQYGLFSFLWMPYEYGSKDSLWRSLPECRLPDAHHNDQRNKRIREQKCWRV